jgi:predicted DNA-binding transcriptional regulator AlpA
MMTTPRRSAKLQDSMSYPPRAMRADRAAAYLDMSRSKFLELVALQRLPKPKIIDGIRVWDRLALDAAFEDFPLQREDGTIAERRNTFDDVLRES